MRGNDPVFILFYLILYSILFYFILFIFFHYFIIYFYFSCRRLSRRQQEGGLL